MSYTNMTAAKGHIIEETCDGYFRISMEYQVTFGLDSVHTKKSTFKYQLSKSGFLTTDFADHTIPDGHELNMKRFIDPRVDINELESILLEVYNLQTGDYNGIKRAIVDINEKVFKDTPTPVKCTDIFYYPPIPPLPKGERPMRDGGVSEIRQHEYGVQRAWDSKLFYRDRKEQKI